MFVNKTDVGNTELSIERMKQLKLELQDKIVEAQKIPKLNTTTKLNLDDFSHSSSQIPWASENK